MLCSRARLAANGRHVLQNGSHPRRLLPDRRTARRVGHLSADHLLVHMALPVSKAARSSTKKRQAKKKANRLIEEQSPDLLNYANDPVDWYPWGEAAFRKARSEDKMIFLSVGYLTCHWCRVMQKESFTNPEIAQMLNNNFVPVKVDREELPDVDKLYSLFIQGSLGFCGWPLNIFLTPELDPVFGTTYLPTPARADIPEFKHVLTEMIKGWTNEREAVLETGKECTRDIENMLTLEPVPFHQDREDGTNLVDDLMDAGTDVLLDAFDEKYGGFDQGIKFARPGSLKLLMRQFMRRCDNAAKDALSLLLKAIIYTAGAAHDGGIHDHVGGGFYRYAVDRVWHVPHFEKMLLDNVQIVQCYLSIGRMLPERTWFATARSTLDYILRELKSPDGGFYSGQDADSPDPETGEETEGAFYVWKAEDIRDVLTKEEYAIFKEYYGVMDDGNCNLAKTEDEAEILTNCLVIQRKLSDVATSFNMEESEMRRILSACRKKLYSKRMNREKPRTDEKIVCSYNALAISAFAEASRALHSEPEDMNAEAFPISGRSPDEYLAVAIQTAEFITETLWIEETSTLHRYAINGSPSGHAFAEDFAYLVAAFLDLYDCTGHLLWLQRALHMQNMMDQSFWDATYGGYFTTSEESQRTPFRVKFCFDTEQPSASSVAISNLMRISGIVEKNELYQTRAVETLEAFAQHFTDNSMALPEMAASAHLIDVSPGTQRIVMIGDMTDARIQDYINAMHSTCSPSKTLIAINPSDSDNVAFWNKQNPSIMDDLKMYMPTKTKKTSKTKDTAASKSISLPAVYIYEGSKRIGPLITAQELKERVQFLVGDDVEDEKIQEGIQGNIIDVETTNAN